MQQLYTIEEAHKIFPTNGSSPILVTCNDFRDWVCKYDRASKNLFNELLAAKFAAIWGIRTPEIALIDVRKEHVPLDKFPSVRHSFLDHVCFGSLYLEGSKEVDHSLLPLFRDPGFQRKLCDRADFLKIALFDIWMANDDRNHNNFNLLLHVSPERMHFFYAIDHVNIFNSSHLNYEIAELTEDDSIIKTDLAKVLFGKSRGITEIVNSLVEKFYLCIEECQTKFDEILTLVPASWGINKEETKYKVMQQLFEGQWIKRCEKNFRMFVQSFIIN